MAEEANNNADQPRDAQSGTDAPSVDWEAKYRETLAHSREWEKRAKDNKAAADELQQLKETNMSEQQKAEARTARLQKKLDQLKAEKQAGEWRAQVAGESGLPADLIVGDSLEANLPKHRPRLGSRSRPCGAFDPFRGLGSCLVHSVAVASIGAWREARRHGARIIVDSTYRATHTNHSTRKPSGITYRTMKPLYGTRISGKIPYRDTGTPHSMRKPSGITHCTTKSSYGVRIRHQSTYRTTRSNHSMRKLSGITYRTMKPLYGTRISGKIPYRDTGTPHSMRKPSGITHCTTKSSYSVRIRHQSAYRTTHTNHSTREPFGTVRLRWGVAARWRFTVPTCPWRAGPGHRTHRTRWQAARFLSLFFRHTPHTE